MNIAIVGSGISGLTAAYLLQHDHNVSVFESEDRIGGHTATMDVNLEGNNYAIDTGFIVYNNWTYPNFIRLLNELGVESKETEMTFSVSCEQSGLEYGGNNLNTLFSQRKNLLNPRYYKMLWDIVRFNKQSLMDLDKGSIDSEITVRKYLKENNYSDIFSNKYLIPMGSAIWSASSESVLEMPLLFFVRFFKNHGLLSINNRPQWHVIKGGSSQYLKPLSAGFSDRIHLSKTVVKVVRNTHYVELTLNDGSKSQYDQVIFSCHSDQALSILGAESTKEEKSVLSSIPYQNNEVILHTDDSILPDNQRAWSSWNYWLRDEHQEQAVLSYNMNILQGIQAPVTFCVTLNASDKIDGSKVLGRYNYSHPVFSKQSIAAVERWGEINGVNRSWFCGAYWANGFHEDGVSSGIRVANALGAKW